MLQSTSGHFTIKKIKTFNRVNYRIFRVRVIQAFHVKLNLDESFECRLNDRAVQVSVFSGLIKMR